MFASGIALFDRETEFSLLCTVAQLQYTIVSAADIIAIPFYKVEFALSKVTCLKMVFPFTSIR